MKATAPKVWAIFTYQCEKCKEEIKVQLAVGVEGPRDKMGSAWVPSPFCIECKGTKKCTSNHRRGSGMPPMMRHVRWNEDKVFEPRPANPGWVMVPDLHYGCGKLVKFEPVEEG